VSPEDWIRVEVAYALPETQVVLSTELHAGSTVQSAIEASGILEQFPEIDLARNRVGIFGSVCGLDQQLKPGDRIEIYRPLLHDPKEARRRRAAKK
jgi:putative ubiquitin-RnfH superfamily antitoxin RatB of RatAB toxin-antitoxin module